MIDFVYIVWLIIAIIMCSIPLYLAYCFVIDIFETQKYTKDRKKK